MTTKTTAEQWFRNRADAAKRCIESFNDDIEERGIVWAINEIARLQSVEAENERQRKLLEEIEATTYDAATEERVHKFLASTKSKQEGGQ